ncbi:hypothetical protein VPH35_009369 [Triticum aestivum]
MLFILLLIYMWSSRCVCFLQLCARFVIIKFKISSFQSDRAYTFFNRARGSEREIVMYILCPTPILLTNVFLHAAAADSVDVVLVYQPCIPDKLNAGGNRHSTAPSSALSSQDPASHAGPPCRPHNAITPRTHGQTSS